MKTPMRIFPSKEQRAFVENWRGLRINEVEEGAKPAY
jgi:hypothetical protein